MNTLVTGKNAKVMIGGKQIAYVSDITFHVKKKRYVHNVKWLPGGKALVNGHLEYKLQNAKWVLSGPAQSWMRALEMEGIQRELEYRWLKKLEHEILGDDSE